MAPELASPSSYHNTVCVMDASGTLGSALVRRLLNAGYSVHAAAQNGELKLKGLANDNKNKRLKVFQADPFDYKSILDALNGCSALFYSFEPPQDQPIYDELTAEVEARAAHNVLEACGRTNTLDKIVYTSSAAAVIWRDGRDSNLSDVDERHWTDISFCRRYKLWYALSKTLAEKTAWALAMDRDMSMVSINSGLLLAGAPNSNSHSDSITHPYLKGAAQMYQAGVLVTVDLDFLVDAQVAVLEDVSSYGRYLCFNSVVNTPNKALQLASLLMPSSPPSSHSCDDVKKKVQQRLDNKKLDKLMMGFHE